LSSESACSADLYAAKKEEEHQGLKSAPHNKVSSEYYINRLNHNQDNNNRSRQNKLNVSQTSNSARQVRKDRAGAESPMPNFSVTELEPI